MTYAIADIHGRYDKYLALLERISFSENDTLYVLGDIIDRYDDGIKMMLDMIRRSNVVIIMGNHEAMMLDTLNGFTEITEEAVNKMFLWVLNGGEATMNAFLELEENDSSAVFDLLKNAPLYKEVEVNGNKFVLLHGGLDNFSVERPLCDYLRDEILWTHPDFNAEYFPDKYLIVGHTPTNTICGEPKIYRSGKLFDIDCGIAYEKNVLGCLCLDNFEEIYV